MRLFSTPRRFRQIPNVYRVFCAGSIRGSTLTPHTR
jgi:hypothetical protein